MALSELFNIPVEAKLTFNFVCVGESSFLLP